MFCCASLYVHSSFAIILDGEERERAGCFALFVFLVSHECCAALPRDAMVVNPITVGNFAFPLIARRWVGLQTL